MMLDAIKSAIRFDKCLRKAEESLRQKGLVDTSAPLPFKLIEDIDLTKYQTLDAVQFFELLYAYMSAYRYCRRRVNV